MSLNRILILAACITVALVTVAFMATARQSSPSVPDSALQKLQSEVTGLKREVDDLRRQFALAGKQTNQDSSAIVPRTFAATAAMGDDPFLGDPKAETLAMVFIDFQCVPCRLFYRKALKDLRERASSTPNLKLLLRDFPLEKNKYATRAAQFAHCAGEQSHYWEAFDLLFSTPDLVDAGDFEPLQSRLPGVDEKKLSACLNSTRYAVEIRKDVEDGLVLGAKGAPGTFIGQKSAEGGYRGVFIRGAQPAEVILSEIDRISGNEGG